VSAQNAKPSLFVPANTDKPLDRLGAAIADRLPPPFVLPPFAHLGERIIEPDAQQPPHAVKTCFELQESRGTPNCLADCCRR
jgi:hypothetical protein